MSRQARSREIPTVGIDWGRATPDRDDRQTGESVSIDADRALLSPEQVATACGLSRRAVYRAIERGELPAVRLCSRLRILIDDFESWLAANRVEPVPRTLPSRRPLHLPAANGL